VISDHGAQLIALSFKLRKLILTSHVLIPLVMIRMLVADDAVKRFSTGSFKRASTR
jgi:hypothetical protein